MNQPIIVTFAFLLGAQLAGAIGAIVAIPLAAVVQAFVVKYLEGYQARRRQAGARGRCRSTGGGDPTDLPRGRHHRGIAHAALVGWRGS